jgi:tryptophanyl-tRNA synthetase
MTRAHKIVAYGELGDDNQKLVAKFGAKPLSDDVPHFYTFTNGLFASQREFDVFYAAVKAGKKCAIVSGVNASGTLHFGHKPVFDTNLFFQKEFGIPVFIPISDDESYVSGKVKTQEEGLSNALRLAKEMLAYGFDPHNTYFIIDQIYTDIYNLAIKLSKKLTLNEIIAVYGYTQSDNPGLFFYPTIQSAHILFPQFQFQIDHVLVIIGPDEDAHIRIGRDLATRFSVTKPSILHAQFLPGIDGLKMSKSKNNGIFLQDSEKEIRKKINKALSGGQKTIEEHRKLGGDVLVDIAYYYLSKLYLSHEESAEIARMYTAGEILSGELKKTLADYMVAESLHFQKRVGEIHQKDVERCILRNGKLPQL